MGTIIKRHIAKRIAEAFSNVTGSSYPESSVTPFLSLNKFVNVDYMYYRLSSNIIKNELKYETLLYSILNMKSDLLIDDIKKVLNVENEPEICFAVKKDIFVKYLFSENKLYIPVPRTNSIIVEYSSPNIAKPFHMGHLRSTIVGNFIANIKELNHKVVRLNYLGDWGTQIGFMKIGLDRLNVDLSREDINPIKSLYEAYVTANKDENLLPEAREIFARLESGEDADGLSQWESIRKITLHNLESTYKRLGIKFDDYAWESWYNAKKIQPVIQRLKEEGLASKYNNHIVLNMGDMKTPLLKSDGTSLYLSRDIAAGLDRILKYKCDKIVYVVDKSQSDHMELLKKTVNKVVGKCVVDYISFGRVIGMSTRKGNSIFLSDILDMATKKMAEQQAKSPNTKSLDPETTSTLAVSALMIYILNQRRFRDFKFDWNLALQSTGDSGVKIQYTHCRLVSLEKKCAVAIPENCNPSFLSEPIAIQLLIEIARFEEVLCYVTQELDSSALVRYTYKLCNLVSRCLSVLPVKGQQVELAEQRLLMFHNAKCTLCKSMKVLGLEPLEYM